MFRHACESRDQENTRVYTGISDVLAGMKVSHHNQKPEPFPAPEKLAEKLCGLAQAQREAVLSTTIARSSNFLPWDRPRLAETPKTETHGSPRWAEAGRRIGEPSQSADARSAECRADTACAARRRLTGLVNKGQFTTERDAETVRQTTRWRPSTTHLELSENGSFRAASQPQL
jgi:hypothetical protein